VQRAEDWMFSRRTVAPFTFFKVALYQQGSDNNRNRHGTSRCPPTVWWWTGTPGHGSDSHSNPSRCCPLIRTACTLTARHAVLHSHSFSVSCTT
jgi:hypothetical protein